MTWLAWRQFRASAVAGVIAIAMIAVTLQVTESRGGYFSHDHMIQFVGTLLVAVPALIGAFWGVPLVAGEIESGTYRLVWTQSITRRRWLTTKVLVIGTASAVAAGAVSLMLSAWSGTAIERGRFGTAMFGERGIAPVGYALFALALGIFAGSIVGRVLPAMAATLVAFTVTRVGIQTWLRPHLFPALRWSGAPVPDDVSARPGGPWAWIISNRTYDATGRLTNTIRCGPNERDCLSQFRQVITYQPAYRYWWFQSFEAAIFVTLGLLLVLATIWWLQSRDQ